MAATAIDTTAIAAIVIGLGGTIAAMVYPVKYPNAPKWAVNLGWWGGLFLVLIGVLYLINEYAINLGHAAMAACNWFFSRLVEIHQLPGFWIVTALAGGVAIGHWLIPFGRTRTAHLLAGRRPKVSEWIAPRLALEKFVSPEIFSQCRNAAIKARDLRANVQLLETTLQNAESTEKEALRIQLDTQLEECITMEYLAEHRCADAMSSLYDQLRSGFLIGKGYDPKKKKEIYIDTLFWSIKYLNGELLNLQTGAAANFMHAYENILIGKNDVPPPQKQPHSILKIG